MNPTSLKKLQTSAHVFWITGLSGAGKTTIGQLLYQHLLENGVNTVFLDGDILRNIFGSELGHSFEDRQVAAFRNSRLCKFLSDQGICVVCSTISLIHKCQDWNHENINNYFECYLKVPMDILQERDIKNIYLKAKKGELKNVVGVDIEAQIPIHPNITIENDGLTSPEIIVNQIIEAISL